ncbi:ATP-binding cassette domain-containing protein [Brachybacterium sp. YJGR34]|uniref:ATP-binding cassette domain-containing protein n=1 Tax=Brachybacterium sp. YJGR34 TaxID=2059911 RepID=UPI000E0C4AD5|nr:ATP-binding cassette domain-containing protein [Brachybacterium sp. YJGR34]
MSAETAPRPGRPEVGAAPAGSVAAEPALLVEAPILVEAEDLEIVLPSGDGVGPWTGTVRAGEEILLLGPSGAGKSTLLLALAGAVPSHLRATVRGTLRVAGGDPVRGGVLALADHIGYLGQDPVSGVCLPGVEDEIALPLENRGVAPSRIGERIEAALAAADAGPLREREAHSLSGGQLQRVALAAATVAGPSLLLLDEPTSMLDADGVAAVRASIGQAVARPGVASVLVEHRLDEWAGERGIDGLPPRTLALDRSGRVLADGPTAEVLQRHGQELAAAGCWLPRDVEARLAREAGGQGADADRAGTDTDPAPGSGAEVLLRARGLALGHGERTVLSGVDLDLVAGQVLAIVGRNGAGKSTLLGGLARLDAPLTGTVEGAAAGLVFQRPEAQFVGQSVRSELADTGAAPERREQMLDELDLRDWAEASPYRLSGGQKRRLALGAMLLRERPVLLADEPDFGLDHAAHRTVRDLLRRVADEGRAVALTTHDLRVVAAADAVVVITDGTAQPPRPPGELLADRDLLRRAGLVSEPAGPRELAPAGAAAEPSAARDLSAAQPHAASAAPIEAPSDAASRTGVGPRRWLARANPAVLLGVLTALSVVCLFLARPAPLLGLYLALALAVMATTRIGPLALVRAQLPFTIFAAGVFCVNALSRPGRELWPELPVRVTEEGVVMGAALALRALVIGLGALAVARATDPRSTMISLQQQARLPARYAIALLAGRRLLDELPGRWRTLQRAHRVRLPLRPDGTVPTLGPRRLLTCAFSLLVDAIRSAERIALALETRGLRDGPRTVYRPVGLSRADAVVVAVCAAVTTAVLAVL